MMKKKAITVGLIPDTPSNRQSLNYDLLLFIIIIIILIIILLIIIIILIIYVCEHIVTGSTDRSIPISNIIRVCLILQIEMQYLPRLAYQFPFTQQIARLFLCT